MVWLTIIWEKVSQHLPDDEEVAAGAGGGVTFTFCHKMFIYWNCCWNESETDQSECPECSFIFGQCFSQGSPEEQPIVHIMKRNLLHCFICKVWVVEQQQLHTGEFEKPVASQSIKLDASAAPPWH